MIIGTLVGLVLGGVLSWLEYQDLDDKEADGANRYKTLAICLWIGGGIFFLFICCLCSQINLALKLIKAASRFVSETPTVVFVPLIQTALLGVTIIVWLFGFLYTYSVGDLEY